MPHINPEAPALIFAPAPKTSAPKDFASVTMHVLIIDGVFSSVGRKNAEPKSMTNPILFLPATAFVFPHSYLNDGTTRGLAASGTVSPGKAMANP